MLTIHALSRHPLTQRFFWQQKAAVADPVAQPMTSAMVERAHHAFHRTYRRFAQEQPGWVAHRFDDLLLRMVLPALAANAPLPTAYELALAWDRQFGILSPYPFRLRQLAELNSVADRFLRQLAAEYDA